MITVLKAYRNQLCEAVRITLTLEPCYLVSVGLDIFQNPNRRAVSFMCNCKDSVEKCAAVMERDADSIRILKYFDHMSKIPRLKVRVPRFYHRKIVTQIRSLRST